VVTREQIAAIKPGTQRARVRDVLGSPLLADPFHAQRWDYVFVIRRQGTEPQQRSVVVLFDGDVVKSVQAPDLPSELEFVASISRPSRGEVPKLELTDEERKSLPLPPKVETAAAAAVPQGAVRTYPPLEAP
jgi:outer membrane protein assembly factor BamE